MEENILRLIVDYSRKGRIIDKRYIDTVIDIVVNSLSLNGYVRNTYFKKEGKKEKPSKGKISIQLANESDFADLAYNFINHDITVYIDKIPKIYQQVDEINFDANELAYFKTTFYTQRILHELDHAYQEKMVQEEDSLESKILNLSIPKVTITNESSVDKKREMLAKSIMRMVIYMQNYEYCPHERMAEINSQQRLISILSSSTIKLPNTIQYLNDNILNSLIDAYSTTFSPTIKFVSEIDKLYKKNPLAEFDWYDKEEEICLKKSIELYPFEQRIRWGLPIEEENKTKLLQKLKSSKYGNIWKFNH